MVNENLTANESIIWNESYSIESIMMIVICAIRFQQIFGCMYMQIMNRCMLNWFRLIFLDANNLISDCKFKLMFTSTTPTAGIALNNTT